MKTNSWERAWDTCGTEARVQPEVQFLWNREYLLYTLSFYFEIPSIHHASETWLAPPSPPPRSALPRQPTFPSPSFTLPSCHLSLTLARPLSPDLSPLSPSPARISFFLRYTYIRARLTTRYYPRDLSVRSSIHLSIHLSIRLCVYRSFRRFESVALLLFSLLFCSIQFHASSGLSQSNAIVRSIFGARGTVLTSSCTRMVCLV